MPTLRAAAPIPVWLALPSALWNQLLAPPLAAAPGLPPLLILGAHASSPPPPLPCVLLTALHDSRPDWHRLARLLAAAPAARLLLLADLDPAAGARALRLGARACLDRETPLPALIDAIRAVHRGELCADPKLALGMLDRALQPAAAALPLTPRELGVLRALADGLRNKEIADRLAISETTVKSHLNRAYRKLHLTDRLQAALYVERQGLDA